MPTHVRVSVGPMSVRAARTFGARAKVECERIVADTERGLVAMAASEEGGAGERFGFEPFASVGDVIVEEAERFEGVQDADGIAVVREVAAACREAVRRMAANPDDARRVDASLVRTAGELRGVQALSEAGTVPTDLVDGVARATIARLLSSFGADPEALERVAKGGLTAAGLQTLQPPDDDTSTVPFLSGVISDYLRHRGGNDPSRWNKDVKRAGGQAATFIDYAGDRPINEYGIADLEDFARDLECLPRRAEAVKDDRGVAVLKGRPVREQIAYGQQHPELPKVSKGTIKNGFVAAVRPAVSWACRRHRPVLDDPFKGARIAKPSRATIRRYRPLPMGVVNAAIRQAVEDDSLLAPLVMLALLSTRRLGVLTHINGGWLEDRGSHWVCRPTPTVSIDGRTIEVPEKTEQSLLPFVLHSAFVKAGILDAMKGGAFLFAPVLGVKNPAAAMSKRANALLRRAGAGGRDDGEVFHSLRAGGIVHYRRHVPDAARLQAGHAASDDHGWYDHDDVLGERPVPEIAGTSPGLDFGPLDTASLVSRVATAPLPHGLDVGIFAQFNMQAAIAKAERNARTQRKRLNGKPS